MNRLDEIRERANSEERYSPPITDPAWKEMVQMQEDILFLIEKVDSLNNFEQSECAKLLEENGKLKQTCALIEQFARQGNFCTSCINKKTPIKSETCQNCVKTEGYFNNWKFDRKRFVGDGEQE